MLVESNRLRNIVINIENNMKINIDSNIGSNIEKNIESLSSVPIQEFADKS